MLRSSQSDPLLHNYSAVIVDEAHERGVNSDVLIGMLSRIADVRGFCSSFVTAADP